MLGIKFSSSSLHSSSLSTEPLPSLEKSFLSFLFHQRNSLLSLQASTSFLMLVIICSLVVSCFFRLQLLPHFFMHKESAFHSGEYGGQKTACRSWFFGHHTLEQSSLPRSFLISPIPFFFSLFISFLIICICIYVSVLVSVESTSPPQELVVSSLI